jgi:hypothetical protein
MSAERGVQFKKSEVADEILDAISKAVKQGKSDRVAELAEAWAWLMSPAQAHGGGKARSTS